MAHKQIRKDVKLAMEAFLESDWIGSKTFQRYLQWGITFMTYLLLSSINTLTMGWLSMTFEAEQLPTNYLLGGWLLIELGLTLYFICQTPLKNYLFKSNQHMKWE